MRQAYTDAKDYFARLVHAWCSRFREARDCSRGDALESGLPDRIGDEELLSRFLKSKSYFSVEKKRVKYGAFLPNPKDGTCSVFRHTGEPANELWTIGRSELGKDASIYGAGILSAEAIRTATLVVTASEPPPRHANIEGWPADVDPVLTAAMRKKLAIVLADEAKLLLHSQ